jgi:hypothetical protein
MREVIGKREQSEADLEVLAKLDEFSHTFVHLALDECLSFTGKALFLSADKFTEGREGILKGGTRG